MKTSDKREKNKQFPVTKLPSLESLDKLPSTHQIDKNLTPHTSQESFFRANVLRILCFLRNSINK